MIVKASPIAAVGELLGNRSFVLLVLYFTLPALAGWVVRDWMPAILKAEFGIGQGKAGVSATLYRSKKLNEAAIRTKNMPAAPPGKQYVLWLQHGATMTQAGVMPEGPDNKVVLSGDAATADGAAVSIEDAGSEPTSPSDDIAVSFTLA